MRPSFLLAFLLLVFVEFARTGEAWNGGDRAGAFIGWHGEITRPSSSSSYLARTGFGANTQRDDDDNDHQSTRVKHPSITFETLVMKDHKPKPSHHASSICEISSGQFLVSWFAGQLRANRTLVFTPKAISKREMERTRVGRAPERRSYVESGVVQKVEWGFIFVL